MPIEVNCPGCKRRFILSDALAGNRLSCVKCGAVFDVSDTQALATEELISAPVAGPSLVTKVVLLVVGGVMVLALTGAIIVAIVLPAIGQAEREIDQEFRRRHLVRIAAAMLQYAADHDDALPYHDAGPLPSLALLHPDYINEPARFTLPPEVNAPVEPRRFPPDTSLAGLPCAYRYRYRTAAQVRDADTVVLTEPPDAGFQKVGVISADGKVGWKDPAAVVREPEAPDQGDAR